ncbi:hypothetical protein C7T94_00510 [Pedobacter yulinensis]|uniref:Uncharacterized protein n=1 Tax=Pedobacter yulinensis TaxID=2126353 RepID=A0A2T3HQH6_9SPHI|nr:hypothetical protein [Pedobacter yulinensis]PST84651.1 hypothetical protein C7T94_00510 [Pedobacter yulinensis]
MKSNKNPVEDKYGATDADYEYSGAASRSAWPPLIFSGLLAAALVAVAWLRYDDLRQWELTGGSIRMYAIERLCYELGGVWLFPVFLICCAVLLFYAGIKQYRHRRRLIRL